MPVQRIIVVSLALLTVGACDKTETSPQASYLIAIDPTKISSRITEHGTYRVVGEERIRSAPDTAAGAVGSIGEIELLSRTQSLPAVRGATFGFRYSLTGPYHGRAEGFEMRALHPALRLPNGVVSTMSTAAKSVVFQHGVANQFVLYTLDNEFELTPGQWTLQILHKRDVILSRTFTLTQ